MAKKGRKSQPVVMRVDDDNIIRIKIGIHKVRAPIMVGGRHHTREDDVRKGKCRKPKHKGRAEY